MPQRLDYEAITPQGIRALGEVYRYIARSELNALLIELIYLRISQIEGYAYYLDFHTKPCSKRVFPHVNSVCFRHGVR